MANRSILYDQEQLDPFDVLWQIKDILAAIGALELDLSGQTTTVVTGFSPTPTGPASLTINLTSGRIYQQSVMDSTAYGALASDATVVQQQGFAPAQSVTLSTAGLAAGQSMWALVQAQFSQVDQIRVGDPTNGVLNFFNSANSASPLSGPNGTGSSLPTERLATVAIQVIYGTPAASGSEAPPNPTNGWVPLYLVDLAFAQTAITAPQILVAGPSVGSNVPNNYPGAPFLAGLLNQHHKGTAGQGPQIDLTSEVKNILPLKNLPGSNPTTGGIFTGRIGSGNPNGNQAGNFNVNGGLDLYWDQVNLILYACTVTGTALTAVWTSVVGGSTNLFAGGTSTGSANAQVVATTTPSGFARTPGQIVTFTAGFVNTTTCTLNVSGTGPAAIQKNSGGSNVPLSGGELNGFETVIWTGSVYLLQSAVLGALAALGIGQWLKNDGAGNLTLNVDASLQDNGGGKLQVAPGGGWPSGTVTPYAGAVAPAGWFLCQGAALSRTVNAALFAVCGITYGSGDGVNTFNVPDLRGRVPAGIDAGANVFSGLTLGLRTGTTTVSLTTSNLPPYTPAGSITNGAISTPAGSVNVSMNGTANPSIGFQNSTTYAPNAGAQFGATNSTVTLAGSFAGSAQSQAASGFVGSAQGGSNQPVVTTQPTMGLQYIIKL